MLKEGIIIAERYEIISRVGAGGMADVYKAMDHKLNRMVAVKILKAEFRQDTGFIAKFKKEAQAAAGLSHPNIVNVFDVGEDRGLYYIVMELVEGITLKNYIIKKGKLSIKEATSIAIQVSLGLEAAHNQGIIHRDVKPQNIIISTDGKVKLSDFGIAKATNSNTITANVMGSVHYSSPEQVRGGFSDAKSDIYSLGVTMYEMVTGRVPFDGDTTVSIAIKHLQEEIIPPSRYTPDLPYSLEQIILKCTQKDPSRRYETVGELIDDLKHSLTDPQGSFVSIAPAAAGAGAASAATAASSSSSAAHKTTQTVSTSKAKSKASYSLYDDDDDDDFDDEEDYKPKKKARKAKKVRDDYDDDDDDEVSSKLEKAITIGGFLIGAVIIVILVIIIGNMTGLFSKKTTTATTSSSSAASASVTIIPDEEEDTDKVRVPDLMGYSLEEATKIASQYGLEVKQTGTQSSDTYAAGLVVYQETLAGSNVASGSTINVVLSSGAEGVAVPSGLVGITQTDAENALAALGFTVSAELTYSDMPVGTVAAVNPIEGTTLPAGSEVHLYISQGPMEGSTEESSETETTDGTSGSNAEVNADTNMAADVTIYEPGAYMGGSVTILLQQNGQTTTIYEGESPWGEDYSPYSTTIYGANGQTTGTIVILDYNGDQIDSYEIEFSPIG